MAETLTVNIPQALRDVYSREIIHAAQPRMRFSQFAKKRTDLSVNPGGTVKFTKFNSITKGGRLVEGVPISNKVMGTTEIGLTVDEFGNGIQVSEKSIQLSMIDVLNEGVQLLANDCAQVLDLELRDAALATTNSIYGGGRTSGATLTVADKFTTSMIKDAVEALTTNNAYRFDGEYFICIAHPHQLRQLRDDPSWIQVHQYNGVENVYRGEVGMYEGVRFVETTQMPKNNAAASAAKGYAAIPTWEAIIFGDNSYAWAEALPVELRDNGVEDYGRKHGLAWYAIWGFGIVEDSNIFKLITA